MAALLIAVALALTMVLGGAGWARLLEPSRPSVALGSTVALAGLVVLVGDNASIWGFQSGAVLAIALVIVALGWLLRTIRPQPLPKFTPENRLPQVAIMGVAGLALSAPLLLFPVPLDTDAQGFGYLALMLRDGGALTTLAPWHPEIHYLYSPGALLIFASLSRLFSRIPMSAVMMGAAHAAAFVFMWLAWEFGRELGLQADRIADRGRGSTGGPGPWSWATGISAALSVGLWSALLDSHYTAIFGLLFALACLTCLFRYLRTGSLVDAGLAALTLAAVTITQADIAIALGLGMAAMLTLGVLAVDRPSLKQWLVIGLAIPSAAAALILPWLTRIWPLIDAGIRSPFPVSGEHWRVMTVYHGLVWPVLAIVGAVIFLRHRPLWVLTMVGWLAATVEVTGIGLVERLVPPLQATLFRFDYPFSLAWHAPLIPYMALGAGALRWLADTQIARRITRWVVPLGLAAVAAIGLIVALRAPLLQLTRGRLGIYGAFASTNDVLAMRWLRDHTPTDARVLNYPGDYEGARDWEGHWAPVISERDCVYFRSQPFFLLIPGGDGEERTFLGFWRDPADPHHLARLRDAGIEYVLVPEVVGDPASWDASWRWQPPALLPGVVSQPADAPYLQLAFRAGGAQVYQVVR